MHIPGYRLIRELGRGGFGTVYLAEPDGSRGTRVAVKVLHHATDANLRRFYREAALLQAFARSPNVVDLLDGDLDADEPYLVMEYCGGGSLRKWVGEGQPWRRVVRAIAQAASALSHLHARGGFHRDIKPDNLLLARDGEREVVKLGDFGIARDPVITTGPITRSGGGTAGYMAPELMGRQMTAAADVYSLGVTCIELLTGGRDLAALAARPDVPRSLHPFIASMVHPNAAQRPSAQGVHDALIATALLPDFSPALVPATPRASAGAAPRPVAPAGGGAVALGTLALGGLLVALLTANAKDANGHFHGSDGKYRSGRWG